MRHERKKKVRSKAWTFLHVYSDQAPYTRLAELCGFSRQFLHAMIAGEEHCNPGHEQAILAALKKCGVKAERSDLW